LIADGLNVPPSLTKIIPHQLSLPNCKQLHKNLQISWEVFGPAITMQLSGQVDEDDYMAFGISGSDKKSQMIGADVVVAYIDGHLGHSIDYHIDALVPCVKVLEDSKGVCRDDVRNGQNDFQMHTFMREDGINKIRFRRSLISGEKEIKRIKFHNQYLIIFQLIHWIKSFTLIELYI
jgi:hypothetical protein